MILKDFNINFQVLKVLKSHLGKKGTQNLERKGKIKIRRKVPLGSQINKKNHIKFPREKQLIQKQKN